MELFRIRYRITVTVTDINYFEGAKKYGYGYKLFRESKKNTVTNIDDFRRARKVTVTDINGFGGSKKVAVSNNRYRKYGNVRKRETAQIR